MGHVCGWDGCEDADCVKHHEAERQNRIRFIRGGNLLKSSAQALVNTVNCVGVMGKGLALQFKVAYPSNFQQYAAACARGVVRPGEMFVTHRFGHEGEDLYIINFPTKRHWRDSSRLLDIEAGLSALEREIDKRRIVSVAIPALGCNNGGLDWNVVRPLVEDTANRLSRNTMGTWVEIYEPLEP